MAKRPRNWTRDELLLAFRLYCITPFGALHQHNRTIIELAQAINRTPSAVAMKACNFASLDPVQHARGIRGLSGASHADRTLWREFDANPERIATQMETAHAQLYAGYFQEEETEQKRRGLASGSTEIARTVRARRVQWFFRAAVLASYDRRCGISGLAVPELLTASHIIPWADDVERRADPRNGICLNALHDRAFDRGLITFDEKLRMVVSNRLYASDAPKLHRTTLIELHGQPLTVPARFQPDPAAMAYHREHIFVS